MAEPAAKSRTGHTDIHTDKGLMRLLPEGLKPYALLARWDRPIGWWLLLLPGWWAIALAAPQGGLPDLLLMAAFLVGAVAMRGFGCTINDLADRHYDAKVERTRSRPIPSGRVTPFQALLFLVPQGLVGLAVLVMLPVPAIVIGLASLALIVPYPFMKRITYWPQAWLGLTFNWAALVGWAAASGAGDLAAMTPGLLLYAGGIFWTLGYDTIYAHQDREDDLLVGVKSTALALGRRTKPAVAVFYLIFWGFTVAAGLEAGFGAGWVLAMAFTGSHLFWQIRRLDIDDPALCLKLFKSNRDMGLILLATIILARQVPLGG
ncbi:4-hydroxybenzoate octaprenyltransferase [Tistrella mobilis]|uniref:4-hydroxybenzoate octaprenyltransferase n=1 Tax=Tistrella mobilis (strain KA081020-065) TaxID=1110502 RepID=I3TPH3_TISMK|nr:4-hydroxybenzoate octaprenyltransferase [Tistrella mobilis]AFK54661.1 4-hydroxybenzoate polyprenyltransferase-related prenyltransferase [Tistrella mobilis KA081020-065]